MGGVVANKQETKFVLKAIDGTSSVIDKISLKLGKFNGAIDKLNSSLKKSELFKFGEKFKKLGTSFKNTGKDLTAMFTLPIAAAGIFSVKNWDDQAKAIAQVQQGLISTKNSAKLTFEQIAKEADKIQSTTLFSDDAVLKDVSAQLLTFTSITGQTFFDAQKAILDISTRLGQDVKSSSIQIGKALNDPIQGINALSRVGVKFSDQQKKVIKGLVKSNRLADAQKLILKELNLEFGGSAVAAAKAGLGPLEQLKNLFSDIGEDFGKIILETTSDFLPSIKNALEYLKNLSPETKKTIVVIGAMAAALGPVLFTIGMITTGIGSIISFGGVISTAFSAISGVFAGVTLATVGWIVAIAAAVAAVVAGGIWVYKNWDKVKTLMTNLWNGPLVSVLKWLSPIYWVYRVGKLIYDRWDTIKQFFTTLWDGPLGSIIKFTTPIDEIIDAAKLIKDNWQPISDFFVTLWDAAKTSFLAYIDSVTQKLRGLGTIIDVALFGGTGALFSNSTVTNPDGTTSQNSFGQGVSDFFGPAWTPPKTMQSSGGRDESTAKLTVDFKNMPDGVKTKLIGPDNYDLNLGYAGAF